MTKSTPGPALLAMLTIFAVLGGGLLTGCGALTPRLEPPQLEVRNVAFIGGDLKRPEIGLTVHVTNPNPRAIAIQRIDYGITLAGADFAQGTTGSPFVVPASGSADFDLKLKADLLTALNVLGKHLGEREIPYRVTGTLHLGEGLLRTLPFARGGVLPLR